MNRLRQVFLQITMSGFAILCQTDAAVGQIERPDSTAWGPSGGQVDIGFQEHAATWRTPRMTLYVDPWLCIRHVGGTPQRNDELNLKEPWDNIRGAVFYGELDGIWTIAGSLEEFQGIPTAWECYLMGTEQASPWLPNSRMIPGWGRSKGTAGGRIDAARSRSRIERKFPLTKLGDSLQVLVAYDSEQWGNALAPISFDNRSTPYPNGSLAFFRKKTFHASFSIARLAGTELSEAGNTFRSFRKIDAIWSKLKFQPQSQVQIGILVGHHKKRPWSNEPGSSAQFNWSSWASLIAIAESKSRSNQWTAEWVPHVASALSWSSTRGAWRGTFTLARVQTQSTADVLPTHAGTPLGSPLLPLWGFDNAWASAAVWRGEGALSWTQRRMRAGLHVLTLANQGWLEAWGAWTLQTEWPLHLTAGLETWRLEGSPNMPNKGLRWRAGVSHTLVMSPGRPTFAGPCCH